MRIESSIITSLSELRAIEQERIAEERAAMERDRLAQIEARRCAEQAVRDAEEARLAKVRDEQVRIENAKAGAERELRMRVEAAEAAERARLMMVLEQQRAVDEMELRRAEVAKKRPTWMIAVTCIAAVAAIALTVFAIDSSNKAAAARRAAQVAEIEKEAAKARSGEAAKHLQEMEGIVAENSKKVADAQKRLDEATNAAARRKAQDDIDAAKAAEREAQKRRDEWQRKKDADDRANSGHIDTSCFHDTLGCIDGKPKKKK